MTAFGYMRLSKADDRDPDRLARDRAAVVQTQAEYVARGGVAGELVTDGAEEMTRSLAARPGGFRVGRLAQAGDVILTPSAGRLARSVKELLGTFEDWHARGVVGVVIDLRLDYGQAEARAALRLMEAGASLNSSIARSYGFADMTTDQLRTQNRWGLFVAPRSKRATVVPEEFELGARCAAWAAAGASVEKIALHLIRTREPKPERWKKKNRVRFLPSPFWTEETVATMIRGYHVVADLYTRGVVGAPKGFVMPTFEPQPLPARSTTT